MIIHMLYYIVNLRTDLQTEITSIKKRICKTQKSPEGESTTTFVR